MNFLKIRQNALRCNRAYAGVSDGARSGLAARQSSPPRVRRLPALIACSPAYSTDLDNRSPLERALGYIEVEKADMIERPKIGEREPGAPNQGQFTFP